MTRYFVRARVEDADGYPIHRGRPYLTNQPRDDEDVHVLDVPEHEPTPTGILTADGKMILRAPRPIGFGRDGEW